MPTINMDGSHKMELLVIGKSKNPHAFKRVSKVPVNYTASASSWMTTEIFKE